jgi:predicted small lipoprotein YifL
MKRVFFSGLALLVVGSFGVAGCGKVGELEPKSGASMPSRAYGQEQEQTATALITPSVQSRPGRSDELLRRSESRSDDPFDLPPGTDPATIPPGTTSKTTSRNQPANPQNGSKPQ